MASIFYRNHRLLILTMILIGVAGMTGLWLLPRMEDPPLTPRAATVTTIFPGADAERVEALVTEKIEDELRSIQEIKEVRSSSRTGFSLIAIELRDDIRPSEAPTIWARVRDKADEAALLFPPGVLDPEFERLEIRAFAMILGLKWTAPTEPNLAILKRLAKDLQDQVDTVAGTERTELFGEPQEELLVTLDPAAMAALQVSPRDIAQRIAASDAKQSAGQLHTGDEQVMMEVSGEIDSLSRLRKVPVQAGDASHLVELGDLATIERATSDPPDSRILLEGQAAVAVGVLVRPQVRLDRWTADVQPVLEAFRAELPPGIELEVAFEQTPFVQRRMDSLFVNLLQGGIAVLVIVWIMHGLRTSFIIGLTLPLACLLVLAAMHWMDIPIHQMSFTGLIISLGLLIDASIVVVDEVTRRLRSGKSPQAAVSESTKFMALPLFNATLTTVLSFGPIALMPGGAGEFVGAIGTVTITAVTISMILALTVIAGMAGIVLGDGQRGKSTQELGFSSPRLQGWYEGLVMWTLRHPRLSVALNLLLPIAGFVSLTQMPEQFFPPADRNQFHVELELPTTSSLADTTAVAQAVRAHLLERDDVERVAWFLGESAPVFYYNVIPERKNAPNYGQAIVDCRAGSSMRELLTELQAELSQKFPQVTCLVRQLEQGPPFSAPIEVRLFGPDTDRLRELGEEVRLALTQTNHVIHTRSELSESVPKIMFALHEADARLTGLNNLAIAAELNGFQEGVIGGSMLEGTEELPVRVRIADGYRRDVNEVLSRAVVSPTALESGSAPAVRGAGSANNSQVPLLAISELRLDVESGGISRWNGQRMNEVQAFLTAGVIPSTVQAELDQRLAAANFTLPAGYTMRLGGVAMERDEAVQNLIGNTAVLITVGIATLVLSFQSFRLAAVIFLVAGLSVGLGFGSLWLMGLPWGFMGLVGTLGMTGAAVNDSIVVLTVLSELPAEKSRDLVAIRNLVVDNTRHILSTTLTTIFGFTPLILGGGEFWPPIAATISGGVGGATFLALFFVPCMFLLLPQRTPSVRPEEL